MAAGGTVIKYRRFKYGTDGALSLEGSEQSVTVGTSLASNTSAVSSSIDNSSGLWMGAIFRIEFPAFGSSATGTVTVYQQLSTDAGTTWADTTSGAVAFSAVIESGTWAAATAAIKRERLLG
jgi:hypothetical protein